MSEPVREPDIGGSIMEIKIVNDLDNKLLNRNELDFTVEYEGPTPSRADVRKKLAALLNKEIDLVLIQKMESEYGHQLVKGYAKVYESADRMKQIEPEHILQRNTLPEEPEEVAEEAPAEESESGETATEETAE